MAGILSSSWPGGHGSKIEKDYARDSSEAYWIPTRCIPYIVSCVPENFVVKKGVKGMDLGSR